MAKNWYCEFSSLNPHAQKVEAQIVGGALVDEDTQRHGHCHLARQPQQAQNCLVVSSLPESRRHVHPSSLKEHGRVGRDIARVLLWLLRQCMPELELLLYVDPGAGFW